MIRGLAQRTAPFAGETANGDAVYVRQDARSLLVAVIDALGHGERAALVAAQALDALRGSPPDQPARLVVERVHAALLGSRGAAMTVAVIGAREVEAIGVGNVALRAVGLELGYLPSPGVLGGRVRRLREARGARSGRARLFLSTDGLSGRFDPDGLADLDAEAACARLFASHAKPHDDATLVVIDL